MMRHAVALLALTIASAASAYSPPFVLNKVAPGDYVHPGKNVSFSDPDHDDIANLGLVVGSKCAAVIDTGGSVAVGQAFRAAIRKITTLPVCYVINTHWHPDHVFGNLAFKAAGTVFVGHAELPAELKARESDLISQYSNDLGDNANAAFVLPSRTVEVGKTLTLDLGDRKLTLRAWPPAHTDTDVTVRDERTQTLFLGDLLFRQRIPALDGNLDGWLKAIAKLRGEQASVVVPGHGTVGHDLKVDFAAEQHYLKALRDDTCAYIRHGGGPEDAPQTVMSGQQGNWLLWDQHHPTNVTRAYTELEWPCFK